MCGIVGLLVKKRELRASLGQLATPMFQCMGERGPDSGGMAVFGDPTSSTQRRFNLFVAHEPDWVGLFNAFCDAFNQRNSDSHINSIENHAILFTAVDPAETFSWRSGRLVYRGQPLSEVVADLPDRSLLVLDDDAPLRTRLGRALEGRARAPIRLPCRVRRRHSA